MRTKQYLALREAAMNVTGVFGTPAFKYDLGASLANFRAGQRAVVLIQMTKDGSTWEDLVEFTLDDATEVIATQVYVQADAVRAKLVSATLMPEINLWMSETD